MPPASSQAVLRYIRRLAGAADDDSTDGQLLARFIKDRDEAAFATLVERHGPMVLNVCRRRLNDANEVDDAFQAVFLVLVKKARSIRKPSLLGNWLYGVACRAAANARRQAWRRHSRTQEIDDMPATQPPAAEGWHELRPLLDEELERLPEKYRAPLVLCYLQGKTYTEAARILGWADGTVSGRLARGRTLLRAALLKRGLTLSAVALTALLTEHAVEAYSVPVSLASTTIKAALLVAAGTSLAAGASTGAAALTEGVLKAMFLTKLKIATAVVLTLAVAGMGGGMFTFKTWAGAKGDEKKTAAASKEKGESKPGTGVNAPAPPEVAKQSSAEGSPKANQGRQMHDVLATTVMFDGRDDPKSTLDELLEQFAAQYNLNFVVNERAFEEAGINDVQSMSLTTNGKPLPKMKNVRFSTVLNKALSRIPEAIFVVRRDHIEITTERALRRELGIPGDVALLPLVSGGFEKIPLDEALKQISTSTGFNIVLDAGKLDDRAMPVVTAHFDNVPVDTAVRVLAEMSNLRAVLLDNVLFVTSKDSADRMQRAEDKRKGQEVEGVAAPTTGKPMQ
jgi:RNA polymerase sigma factor (sigma-70 family)